MKNQDQTFNTVKLYFVLFFQDLKTTYWNIPYFATVRWAGKIFFTPFYVCTAVRKFFFFLDPLRTGKRKSYHLDISKSQ